MSRTACLLLVLGLHALSAEAQVVKCTDAKTGAITYTEGKCSSGEALKVVARVPTAEEQADQRVAAAYARDRTQRADERAAAIVRSTMPKPQPVGAGTLSGPSAGEDSAACQRAQHNLKVSQSAKTFRRDTSEEARAMRAVCGLPEPPPEPAVVRTRPCTPNNPKDFNCYR